MIMSILFGGAIFSLSVVAELYYTSYIHTYIHTYINL